MRLSCGGFFVVPALVYLLIVCSNCATDSFAAAVIATLISRGQSALIFAGISLFYGFTGALIAGTAICLLGCVSPALLDYWAGVRRITA